MNLGPISWSLSINNGKFRKTSKAVLSEEIEKVSIAVYDVGCNSDCIIDRITLILEIHYLHLNSSIKKRMPQTRSAYSKTSKMELPKNYWRN